MKAVLRLVSQKLPLPEPHAQPDAQKKNNASSCRTQIPGVYHSLPVEVCFEVCCFFPYRQLRPRSVLLENCCLRLDGGMLFIMSQIDPEGSHPALKCLD